MPNPCMLYHCWVGQAVSVTALSSDCSRTMLAVCTDLIHVIDYTLLAWSLPHVQLDRVVSRLSFRCVVCWLIFAVITPPSVCCLHTRVYHQAQIQPPHNSHAKAAEEGENVAGVCVVVVVTRCRCLNGVGLGLSCLSSFSLFVYFLPPAKRHARSLNVLLGLGRWSNDRVHLSISSLSDEPPTSPLRVLSSPSHHAPAVSFFVFAEQPVPRVLWRPLRSPTGCGPPCSSNSNSFCRPSNRLTW